MGVVMSYKGVAKQKINPKFENYRNPQISGTHTSLGPLSM